MAFACCCWPQQRGDASATDEMFTACLFQNDRTAILNMMMDQFDHTPESMANERRPTDDYDLLMVASVVGDVTLAEILLEACPSAGGRRSRVDGNSALLCACMGGHSQVVEMLLRYSGGDSSNNNVHPICLLPNHEGTTPLMAAAWRGHLELVKRIVAQTPGVSLTTKDNMNRTARDLAQEWGHGHVVQWIDSYISSANMT